MSIGKKILPQVATSRVPQWSTKSPSKVSAEQCKVLGIKDIFDTQKGEFNIYLCDQYGAEWDSATASQAFLKDSRGSKLSTQIKLVQSGDKIVGSFGLLAAGSYLVEIFVESEPVQGSPFAFKCFEDDATISEGGTGFSDEIKEFHVTEEKLGVFDGADKDERNEWTALAQKAQTQKGEVANKIIKQHTRLIRISGKGKGITMSNVPVSPDSLCNSEVFILDTGPIVYQWDGETAGIFLKNKANWYLKMLKDERQGKFKLSLLQYNDDDDQFFQILGGKPTNIRDVDDSEGWVPILYRITVTKKGRIHFKEVASGVGQVLPSHLSTKGVYLYDLGFELSLWEGKQAFKGLRDFAVARAADQFKQQYSKGDILVTRVKEGGLNPVFNAFIGGM